MWAGNALHADNIHNDLPVPLPVVMSPPVWEYNFVDTGGNLQYPDQLDPNSEALHEAGFNALGAEGWEYVGHWPNSISSNAKYYAVFKRIKP